MLNYIWAVMIVIGIIYGAITGHMKEVTEAALQSAQDAVTLCFTMTGVMAFWVGLMQVAEESGLIEKLTRMLSPFISFMFPRIPQGHKSRDYISTNIIAQSHPIKYPMVGQKSHTTSIGIYRPETHKTIYQKKRAHRHAHCD